MYDIRKPLNWEKFLSNIRNNFRSFIEEGGWMAWDEVDEQLEE